MESHKKAGKAVTEQLPRKKLYSLRFLNPTYHYASTARHDPEVFRKLERSLDRDNREQQPVAEPASLLPDDERDEEDLTFWLQFSQQAQKVVNKVPSEKINCYERQFGRLKRIAQNEQRVCMFEIQGVQGIIKDKFKQIHSYHQQWKREKASASMIIPLERPKPSKKSQSILNRQNSPKMIALKQAISELKEEVLRLQQEVKRIKDREARGRKRWLCFLRRMLRKGYFLRRGVIPILEELVFIGYVPTWQDLPECLDQTSKRCLLREYSQLSSRKNKPSSQLLTSRISTQSRSRFMTFTEKELTRDIYKETRQMMPNLLKLAAKERVVLPPLLPARAQQEIPGADWRANEKRRLSHVYQGEKYNLSRSILFGPKVEML